MTTVIIPAAGLASRLRPISNFTSKSMVPVNGRPAISYIIDQIKDWATDIRIVYGKSTDLVDYCKLAYTDLPISFYNQADPRGPLHAIYCALEEKDLSSNDDLVIWLGDTIVLDYENKQSSDCNVVYGKVSDWDHWCLIHENGSIHDKPIENPHTDRALVGIYSFNSLSKVSHQIKEIIRLEPPGQKNEYQISQLLLKYSKISQIETKEWYDCGDFPSLYDSRARLLNRLSRSDNSLYVDTNTSTITKTGVRCKGEIEWYKNVPSNIKPFLPTIYDLKESEYTMEFCSGTSLQDIFVYENLKEDTVIYVLNRLMDVYESCLFNDIKGRGNSKSNHMWIDKNYNRIEKYDYDFVSISDKEFLLEYIGSIEFKKLIWHNHNSSLIHGDLHFGNILFDFNTGKVKLIDPRGEWAGEYTAEGDMEYDMAKLYQSCYCEYMWIVNNVPTNHKLKDLILEQLDKRLATFGSKRLRILSAVMMSSCLPFHNEDYNRQERIWKTSIEKLKGLL